jgi:hypothetical protein
VVDGEPGSAFMLMPGDPHPMPYLRVLLWARAAATEYGEGPWDALAGVWRTDHPLEAAPPRARQFIEASLPLLPAISDTILHARCRAFDGRSLAQLISPQRVSPAELARLEGDAGRAAFTSPYWIWNEAVRLLALNGYRAGIDAAGVREAAGRQEALMLKLGALKRAA